MGPTSMVIDSVRGLEVDWNDSKGEDRSYTKQSHSEQ